MVGGGGIVEQAQLGKSLYFRVRSGGCAPGLECGRNGFFIQASSIPPLA